MKSLCWIFHELFSCSTTEIVRMLGEMNVRHCPSWSCEKTIDCHNIQVNGPENSGKMRNFLWTRWDCALSMLSAEMPWNKRHEWIAKRKSESLINIKTLLYAQICQWGSARARRSHHQTYSLSLSPRSLSSYSIFFQSLSRSHHVHQMHHVLIFTRFPIAVWRIILMHYLL